jgi:hypothetical protein
MKTTQIEQDNGSLEASGFSILIHSRGGQALRRAWMRLNELSRPFLPILHFCMLIATVATLCAVVFANQHLPSWYDETCLVDPAYYKVTEGVWKTRMEFDSLDIEPFAVKYPLLIGLNCLILKCFGMNYALLRGAMLFFGLVPVGGLFWLARRRGLLRSWTEVLEAAFFLACFGLFYWALYIRPEAIVLSVGFLLVLFWLADSLVPLFLTALCIPLCGLHWDVLVLPAIWGWLIWGGTARKPLAVVAGAVLGSIGVLIWYHLAGMWPSYLLEAQRGTSPSIVGNAIGFVRDFFLEVNLNRLGQHACPSNAFLCSLWIYGLGACSIKFFPVAVADKKTFLFFLLSLFSVIPSLAAAAWLNDHYNRLLAPLSCLLAPLLFRGVWRKYPLLLFAGALLALLVSYDIWLYARYSKEPGTRINIWVDEPALESSLEGILSSDDVVLADSPAYFAVRSRGAEMFPMCYAFDLSEEQILSCSAVLIEDKVSCLGSRDYSDFRKTSWSKVMKGRFADAGEGGRLSPDDILAAIADHWHCSFREVPLAPPSLNRALRFRLFRPVFPSGEEREE